MPKIFRYNVYDNGELILQNAKRKEVVAKIGLNTISFARYAKEGAAYKGRYTFDIYEDDEKMDTLQETAFCEKWKVAVAPFKNVVWVKSGGRKLIAPVQDGRG